MDTTLDPLFLSFQLAVAGRYSIDREIGRGGMGVVYLAREVDLDRPVAIKLLPPERARNRALRDRFIREARLAAQLSHPNIIPIHSVDDAGEFVFYVMAFIEGETLGDRIIHRGPLGGSEGTRVLREVALALAHAHDQGVVHRDVKPDNILLERTTGRVLVADFGIAAAAHAASGDVIGTPEFMSPEQALGKELDGRSDVYALGVTAFYALSGRLPFEGASSTELLAKQVTQPAPSLASMGTSVSRKVTALVDRCVAKDPAQRPQTARLVAERLTVAIEQRQEVPVALQAFVREDGRLGARGALFAQVGLLGAGIAATGITGSAAAGYLTIAAGYVVGSAALLVAAARRLLRAGFRQADLPGAFSAETDLAREERSPVSKVPDAGPTSRPPLTSRLRRLGVPLASVGVAGEVVILTVWAVLPFLRWDAPMELRIVASLLTLATALLTVGLVRAARFVVFGRGTETLGRWNRLVELVRPPHRLATRLGLTTAAAVSIYQLGQWIFHTIRFGLDFFVPMTLIDRVSFVAWSCSFLGGSVLVAGFIGEGPRLLVARLPRMPSVLLGQDATFWASLWNGPIGRWAFRGAERLAPKAMLQASMTHRPTELSLGMAVESLFSSLPRPLRIGLADVPATIDRLQSDAERLRGFHDDLDEALGEALDDTAAEYLALRDQRDAVEIRLREVVGAMETIRLNLLRLHAGAGGVEVLTSQLGLAGQLSRDVDRALRAFPSGPVPTPA